MVRPVPTVVVALAVAAWVITACQPSAGRPGTDEGTLMTHESGHDPRLPAPALVREEGTCLPLAVDPGML